MMIDEEEDDDMRQQRKRIDNIFMFLIPHIILLFLNTRYIVASAHRACSRVYSSSYPVRW